MWFTFVNFGGRPKPGGAYRSIDEAEVALDRFKERLGYLAGTHLAAGTCRLAGPYPTRAEARRADITTKRIVMTAR